MLTPERVRTGFIIIPFPHLQPYRPKFKKQGRKTQVKMQFSNTCTHSPSLWKGINLFFNALKHSFILPLFQYNKKHTNLDLPVFPGTVNEQNTSLCPPKFTLFLTLLSSQHWDNPQPFPGLCISPFPKAQHQRHTQDGKGGFKPCQEVSLFNSNFIV